MHVSDDVLNFTLIRCREYLNVTPKSDRLLTAPRDERLIDDGGSSSRQSPQVWNYGLIDQAHVEDLAIELTGIIYQRLFKNPPSDMINSNMVYTCTEGDISETSQEILSVSIDSESGSSEQRKAVASPSRVASLPNVDISSIPKRSTGISWPSQPEPSTSLAGEIIEYLREMDFQELSDIEVQAFNEIGLPGVLLEDFNGPPEHRTARPGDAVSRNQGSEDPHTDTRRRFQNRFCAPKFGSFPGLTLAINILELVDFTSKLAAKANSINRSMKRPSVELEILCLRVEWHSRLLYVVAEEFRSQDGHLDSTYGLVVGSISEIERACGEAGTAIDRYTMKRAGWIFKKRNDCKAAVRTIEELDSMKPNHIIMLQLLQTRTQYLSVPRQYALF